MSTSPTLSTAPFEHPALDYDLLRREGIRHLEGIVGHLWNDFNTHDPGITILEQLCYAITDLGYRASHEVPDLLASGGGNPYQSLYGARDILTSHPVTLLDLRKLIIDVDGVANAWIEPAPEQNLPLHLHEGKRELRFRPDPPYTTPVALRGLLRVLIEKSDLLDRPTGDLKRDVIRRLHAHRPLCADFDEIRVLEPQLIQVIADIEIGPVDDAERVLIDVHEALSEYVSPTVTWKTLAEMLAEGKRSDEIFDGPALDHGFLDTEALERIRRRDAIHTSDLIRVIMGIPGVRAVRNIAVSTGGNSEPWSLPLDTSRATRLDLQGSSITLKKGSLTARLDAQRIVAAVTDRRRRAAPRGQLAPEDRDFIPPAGRDRNVSRYRSIQHHLPAIYGVGAAGLSDAASDRRKAQAKQLKAYLLFFDQLLASYFSQLARAGSLFSFYDEDTRSYATQMVDDPELDLSAVRKGGDAAHRSWLLANAGGEGESGSLSSRKNRFYNHLMARFAEQFTDYSLVLFGASVAGDRLALDKQAFLRRYPRISSARGTGRDMLPPESATELSALAASPWTPARGRLASLAEIGEVSGLEERIVRKLGLTDEERFFLIEHLLLAPTYEDNVPPGKLEFQQVPLLSDCVAWDPYSLQLSFVLPSFRGRLRPGEGDELRRLVARTIREETPAHLTPYVHWLKEADWTTFERAHREWLDVYGAYRVAKLGPPPLVDPRYLRARDARDRIIDLLGIDEQYPGFGKTYPLRDLPVDDEGLTVPFNQAAQIPIEYSQRGVIYELRGDADDLVAQAEGNGGTLLLTTPRMQDNATYNILARKVVSGNKAYLREQATVKVGLDRSLRARILNAAPLDPGNTTPADGDPRIVDWGTKVKVRIDRSQEGVDYHLVQIVGGQERRLSPDGRGNRGDIELEADAAAEDMVIQIHATKVFDATEHRPQQDALLVAELPLKVRARLDLPVSLEPGSIVGFGANATVKIDNTQASAFYSVYVRATSDADFDFGPTASAQITTDVEGGEPRVYVQRPPARPIWEDLAGFQLVGAAVQGNGGTLRLPVNGLQQDSVILVRARKDHDNKTGTIPSSVQLSQAALVLTRPNPQQALKLAVVMAGGKTTGTLELSNGQPGILYAARTAPDGPNLGREGYFHKTDERNAAWNKGIAQARPAGQPIDRLGLRVGVDLAITRGTARPATTPAELATTPPLPPLVDTDPLNAGTVLYFRATKAETRVAVMLAQTARIAAVPKIEPEQAVVPRGTAAKIMVRASAAGDRYELTLGGQVVGAAQNGNGADLAFPTAVLQAATQFVVRVTRPAEAGLAVERRVVVSVGTS